MEVAMSRQPTRPAPPTPSPIAIGCRNALGFSLIELMLGISVVSIVGIGTFAIATHLDRKKDIRVEQANVEQIAQRVGASYASTGRFPTNLREASISDHLIPTSMVQGASLRSVWGEAVDLRSTTIDGKSDAGMEIVYESVPASGCAPFALSAGRGMFDVQVDGASVLDAQGNVDPLLAGRRCEQSSTSQVVFTYYSGASGLALITAPALCASDPTNPLCDSAPPPGTPPGAPPGSPPGPPAPPAPPPTPPTPSPPPGSPPPPVVSPPSTPPPPGAPPPPPPAPPFCSAPAPAVANDSQVAACLAGRVTPGGSSTFTQMRSQTTTWSCPDPWDAAVDSTAPWTAWTPDEAAACAPACVAPPTDNTPIDRAAPPSTQSLSCPLGQSGTWTQARPRSENGIRTTTYACPAPTGAFTANPATDTWLGTFNFTGAWSDTINTCAPICGPAPAPASRTLACAPTETGAITQTHGWDAAASPTCWVAQAWATIGNTCTPTLIPGVWSTSSFAAPEASCAPFSRYHEEWSWNTMNPADPNTSGSNECHFVGTPTPHVECTDVLTGTPSASGGFTHSGFPPMPPGVQCWVGQFQNYDNCDGSGTIMSDRAICI
jgi:type II secretory pathway pseudopilin PulG